MTKLYSGPDELVNGKIAGLEDGPSRVAQMNLEDDATAFVAV